MLGIPPSCTPHCACRFQRSRRSTVAAGAMCTTSTAKSTCGTTAARRVPSAPRHRVCCGSPALQSPRRPDPTVRQWRTKTAGPRKRSGYAPGLLARPLMCVLAKSMCKEHVQRARAWSSVGVTTGVLLRALTGTIVRCVVRSAVASTVVWPLTSQHDDASAVHAVGQSRASGHRPGRRR